VTDFEGFCNLVISDRLKATLPQGPLNYVLSLEGEGWFEPNKIASLADTFVNNRGSAGGQKVSEGQTMRIATAAPTEAKEYSSNHNLRDEPYRPGRGDGDTFRLSPERRCYRCNGIGRFARVCPSNRGGHHRPYRGNYSEFMFNPRNPTVT